MFVLILYFQSMDKVKRIMPLALLHALLLQQSYYGRYAYVHPHYWTLSDLAMGIEAFRLLIQPIHSKKATDLLAMVYSNHCVDSTDASVVKALVEDLAARSLKHNVRPACTVEPPV